MVVDNRIVLIAQSPDNRGCLSIILIFNKLFSWIKTSKQIDILAWASQSNSRFGVAIRLCYKESANRSEIDVVMHRRAPILTCDVTLSYPSLPGASC